MNSGVLFVWVGLFALLWLVVLRPQQQRAKAQKALLSQLSVGDEVLTTAGMYGQITEFDGEAVFLALSDKIEIKITRESIAERVVYGPPPDDEPAEEDENGASLQDDVEDK